MCLLDSWVVKKHSSEIGSHGWESSEKVQNLKCWIELDEK